MKAWINTKNTLKIAIAMAMFFDPISMQAAIAPISNITPAQLKEEFKREVELSLAQFRNSPVKYKYSSQNVEQIDLQEMARIGLQLQKETAFNAATIIPTDMPANSSDESYVAGRVLRHALQQWYKNGGAKNSELLRTTDAIGNGIDTGVSATGEEKKSAFSFKLQPATGKAQIKYKGALNASLTYEAFDNEAKFEIAHRMPTANTTLIFNSISNSDGVLNQVGMRWSF